MIFIDFILKMGALKFSVLCFFGALAIVLVAFIVLKIVKELSVKVGNVAI